MQLAWADAVTKHTGGKALILAPLAVASQTVREGDAIEIALAYSRAQADSKGAITIANYEMLQHFDPREFTAIVLDESSCLKDYTSSTRNLIIESFAATPYRLACTATPSPNDFTELGNHAEFLGIMKRVEMLSQFFTHDGGSTQDWALKGHAKEAFWKWVCSWAVLVKKPSDLGYSDCGYDLPALNMHEHIVKGTVEQARAQGQLFVREAIGLTEQRQARKASMSDRVKLAADIVNAEPGESWVVWCELNDESDALSDGIDGAIEVRGSMKDEAKEAALTGFASGAHRVIVTKPSIAGFGLNWQHCARVVFVGITHSFEQFYQAVRRNWRFGQTREVECHIITSEIEGSVLANLRRKEADASKLSEEMRRYTAAIVSENIRGADRESDGYDPTMAMHVPAWLVSEADGAKDAPFKVTKIKPGKGAKKVK
jgi:superfamily II DNA or RNA helicase